MAPPIPPDPPKFVVVTHYGTSHGSLWDIAEDVFEDGTKWQDIYAENRDLIGADPNSLRAGMRLLLPPLEIRPAYLRSVGKGFDDEGKEIIRKLSAAKSALDGIGNFWGDDNLGTRFSRGADGKPGYETTSAQILEGVGALADFYENVSAGLRKMADRHDDVEWENTIQALDAIVNRPG